MPVLHRNAISFFGMKDRVNYLAFKKIKDMLIAFDHKEMLLTTWSVITGKIISQHKVTNPDCKDLDKYTIYSNSHDNDIYFMNWY